MEKEKLAKAREDITQKFTLLHDRYINFLIPVVVCLIFILPYLVSTFERRVFALLLIGIGVVVVTGFVCVRLLMLFYASLFYAEESALQKRFVLTIKDVTPDPKIKIKDSVH